MYLLGVVGYATRLYVSTANNIRDMVLREAHGCSHFGIEKTLL